jgi:AcrR family transcriptional regulator
MAPQERSARTRDKILVATAEVINELSYEKAKLSDIAIRAGVTTGAFYFHFSGKEDAAQTLIRIQNTHSQEKARARAEAGGPTLEIMLAVSAGLMSDIVNDPIVRAGIRLTTEIHILDSPPVEAWRGWTDFNEMMLEEAIDRGELYREFDIPVMAEVIAGSIAGMHIVSSLFEDIPGLLRRVCAMWVQFLRAYALEPQRWVDRATELFADTGKPAAPRLLQDAPP